MTHNNDLQFTKQSFSALFAGTQTIGQATEECQFTDIISYHTETGLSKEQINFCLYIATEKGIFKIVEYLVQQGADINARPEHLTKTIPCSKKPTDEKNCLYIAAEKGQYDLVKYLIENGAEINAKSENQTPLHIAYKKNHLHIFHYLILKGADIQAKDENNQTVLNIASNRLFRVQERVYDLLKYHNNILWYFNFYNYTDLHFAAEHGHLQNLLLLTEKGAYVNAKEKRDKRTALHLSSEKGYFEIVQCLVEKGADVNAKDSSKRTALHMASEEGHFEIVKYLIKKGAAVNAKNEDKETALNLAPEERHFQIVQCLIDEGADINAEYDTGWTALIFD
jgi:ankyrin repeat protein